MMPARANRRSRGAASFLGTFALVFASMVGLFVFDTFLANMEHAEGRAEGARLYAEGQKLLQEGRTSEAVERFREALTYGRENASYQLELARALMAGKKYAEAESTAHTLLMQDSTNGPANLTMARILAREGRLADASSYYHRAIYGRWPDQGTSERLQVRLELIDMLARENDQQDLLAELLPLQDENLDVATRMRIARLYLRAGSPMRASGIFREILHEQPTNAAAFAGLGDAEFARGNYRNARFDLQNAARLKPGDPAIRQRLDTVNEVLALDPMMRGLSSQERYARAARLLDLASQSVGQCIGTPVPANVQTLLDSSQDALQRRARPGQENDMTNANLDLAEKIWQIRKTDCRQALTKAEEPVGLVLAKASQ